MRIELDVAYAETILNPDYRAALDAAHEQSPDEYVDRRRITEDIIINGLKAATDIHGRQWEQRRLATIIEIQGNNLGPFNDYLQNQGGETRPNDLTVEDLGAGKPEIVKTNYSIVNLARVHNEPIDFMEGALDVIGERKVGIKQAVGPENYATTIKFFADKYQDFPSSHLDKQTTKAVVDECMDGFVNVSGRDKPNFVEMTNVYYAVRTLPKGTFDARFTGSIIAHSLEQLPNYNSQTLSLAIASLSKLDLAEHGESAATLIDLVIRKNKTFETTHDMRQALRSIANLPPNEASNRVFATFMEVRNNLEDPLDMEGLDDTNHSLLRVVRDVIDDPELSQQARELSQACAARAVQLFRREQQLSDRTTEQMAQLNVTAKRIVGNFSRM